MGRALSENTVYNIETKTNSSYGGSTTNPSALYLKVKWVKVSSTATTTTIKVSLWLHHSQLNLAAGSNDCSIIINGVTTSWTGPSINTSSTGVDTLLGEKNITVTHDSNGTFSNKSFEVTYRFNATYGGYSVYYITNHNSVDTITLPALYSACTAPTTISVTSPAKPGNITITWSGATAGTNMSISKYRVYYAIGSSPTTSSSYQDTTSATASLTFSATSRGSTYYFKIKTIGSVSGYDSGLSSAQATCVINQLPNAPTLNKTSQTIISTSTGVSVTATAGAANAGFSSTSVYYATSAGGTKSKYTSAITINPSAGNSSTYYFWTWDGAEYSSSYTSITITKNVKPQITSISASPTTFTALDITAGNNFLGWVDSLTPSITTNKGGTISRAIELNKYTAKTSSFTPSQTYPLTNETLSSAASSKAMGTVSPYAAIVNKYGATLDNGITFYAWRIKYVLTDSYESSSAYYWPESNKWYAIPTMPTLSISPSASLYKTATISLINESSTGLSIEVSAAVGSTSLPLSFTTSTSGTSRTINVTLTNAPASLASITFTVSYSKSGVKKTRTISATARKSPNAFNNFVVPNTPLKPFTSTDPFYFYINWPFDDTTIAAAITNYNITSFILTLTRNNTSYDVVVGETKATKQNDTLRLEVDGDEFYPWDHAWGISTYTDEYNFAIQMKVITSLGESFTSAPQTFKVNFNEGLEDINFIQIDRLYTPSGSTSASSVKIWDTNGYYNNTIGFGEGNTCRIRFSYKGYTEDKCIVNIYFNNSVVSTFEIQNTNSSLNHEQYTTSYTCTQAQSFIIPEIVNDNTPFEITIRNNAGTITKTFTNGLKTIKHTSPQMTLTSLTINENKFSGNVSITSTGFTNGISNFTVSDGSNNYSDPFTISGTGSKSFSNITDTRSFDARNLTLKYVSTVTIYSNTSTATEQKQKTFYLNYITVYQASPTIAYRKNAVGINTSTPKDGAVLDIHNSSTTNNVYLQGLNALWTFDIAAGTIQFNSNTPLDLANLLTIGTTATTAAAGNHTHPTSIATSTATNQVTLGYGGKYSLTAGGSSYIFTMPSLAITGNTAIATNDRIVFADNSDSGKLKRSSIVFDTSITNKYLTQAGTWVDALNVASLTSTGAITTNSTLTTGGLTTIGGNLDVAGNITFDDENQTAERNIRFKNSTDSTYYHNTTIYGGNPESQTSLGIWDTARQQSVMLYSTQTNRLTLMNSGTSLDGDVQILGKSVSWYQKFMQSMPQNTNLNDIIAPGIYHQSTSSYATLALNYPVATAGLLEVFQGASTTYVYQRYTTYGGHYCFQRCRYSNTWYPWHSLKPTEITAWGNTDDTPNLNTLWPQNGYAVYCAVFDADATTAKNFPVASSGFLEVMRDYSTSERYIQRFTTYNSSAVYIRHYYNSAWSAWKKIWPCSATVSTTFNSGGYADVQVPGIPVGAKVIAQRVITGTPSGTSGYWSIAGANVTSAGNVRLYTSNGQAQTTAVSVQIIWSI